jgi:uncharacterized RDD family membrane protein YckC
MSVFRWPQSDTDYTWWSNEQEPDPGGKSVKFTTVSRRFASISLDWGLPLILSLLIHNEFIEFMIMVGMWANSIVLQGVSGQSLGKRAMGIKLAYVPESMKETGWTFIVPGVTRCAIRYVLHILDVVCFIGFIKALLNPYGRSFADAIVRTVVIEADQFDLMTMQEYRRAARHG